MSRAPPAESTRQEEEQEQPTSWTPPAESAPQPWKQQCITDSILVVGGRRQWRDTAFLVLCDYRSTDTAVSASDRVPWLSFSRDVPRVVSSVH